MTGLEVLVAEDAADAASRAADIVQEVIEGGATVIGVATGATPRRLYAELAGRVRDRRVSFEGVRLVALDEYAGLSPEHPASFAAYLRRHVAVPLGIGADDVLLLDGTPALPAEYADRCAVFEQRLADLGGVDLQVLGIGRNAHLAFNEPGSSFTSDTRLVALTGDTRSSNASAFGGDVAAVPAMALSQGLATIMRARTILLLATGETKSDAVAAAFDGPVDPSRPASLLQRHPDVRAVLDPAAASGLSRRGRRTLNRRPATVGSIPSIGDRSTVDSVGGGP